MTNKTKNIVIGATALLLAGAGLLFIFKGGSKTSTKDDSTDNTSTDESTRGPVKDGTTNTTPKYEKYEVATLVSNLNVRKEPNTSSQVLDSLPKGSLIFAKPSGTTGWYAYSKDGVSDAGFISSMYLKKA